MTQTRRRFLGAVTASTAIGIAGCLGDGGGEGTPTDGNDETATATATATETDEDGEATESSVQGATVQVSTHPTHGEILVGPEGLTLYNFDSDEQGTGASTCQDGCARAWPPLTVEDPDAVAAGPAVTADLSTFERADGSVQVAANGWPLYYYDSDTERGEAEGHGVNDTWWVLGPGGQPKRPTAATVAVASTDEYGDVLVDGDGMTLYMFDSDEQGSGASTCSGDCLDAWPPLTSEATPTVGGGVTAEVTTFEREDGSVQVAANGWPLYYFATDAEPGDRQGQGVNDVWWVLGPGGEPKRSGDDGGDGPY